MTPLGRPVEPEVYGWKAGASGEISKGSKLALELSTDFQKGNQPSGSSPKANFKGISAAASVMCAPAAGSIIAALAPESARI